MARKLTDLTQATNISADDLMYLVDAPGGAKNDRSLSMATLFASVPSNLSAAGPDPWFDVTNPAYGAKNDGTNAAVTTAGISAAITAANAVSAVFARGAIVWFPPGSYNVNATLTTPSDGVTLLGAYSSGVGLNASASTITFSNTGSPLFNLTNTNHIWFMWLDFEGSNASNILQRCIYSVDVDIHGAATVNDVTIEHCSFDQWGGEGVYLIGNDITVTDCLFENCCKVYPNTSSDPANYTGALRLEGIENVVEHNNINGVAGVQSGAAGNGKLCAAYFTGTLNHIRFNTFAFGQVGVRMDAGFFNDVLNNRFEYNQRQGLFALSYNSKFNFNRFQNNSMDSASTYNHFTLGDTGGNGYSNRVTGNDFYHITYNPAVSPFHSNFEAGYGLDIQGGNGATWANHNDVISNGGTGWNTALIAPATGSAPLAISPTLIQNAPTPVATGGSFAFNAQAGDEWVAEVNTNSSGLTTLTIGAPTNAIKGMRASLMVYNHSGGVLTTTFNAAFKNSGYTDPADTKFKTAIYQYDGAHWIQQGAWSGDML